MTGPKPSQATRGIVLIGYRGSGKTAVGKVLAALLGQTHIDTDAVISERAGCDISAIFASEGESGFRKRERQTITECIVKRPGVISVGGGAVMNPDNVADLRSIATIVWLQAPAELLWQRIESDPTSTKTRPALTGRTGLDEVKHLLAQRSPVYEQTADLTINASTGTPEELADIIARQLIP